VGSIIVTAVINQQVECIVNGQLNFLNKDLYLYLVFFWFILLDKHALYSKISVTRFCGLTNYTHKMKFVVMNGNKTSKI
jgi:hypothetical protein